MFLTLNRRRASVGLLSLFSLMTVLAFSQGCGDSTGGSSGGASCVASFAGPEVLGQEVSIDSVTELAQSVTLTTAATPGNVQLKLKAVGTPTGNLIVRLETSVSNAPSGIVVESGFINAATIPAGTSDTYYNFTFSAPQALGVGTYWIILKGNSSFTATGVSWMATNVAGAYTGGTALSSTNDSTWGVALLSGKALLFQLGC